MSESSGTPLKTSPNGVQGLAMMVPIAALPLGIHLLGGAVVAVAGIAVTVAPIAVPLAVPLLFNVASKGGFDSVIRTLFPPAGTAAAPSEATSHVGNQVHRVTIKKEVPPVTGIVIQSEL